MRFRISNRVFWAAVFLCGCGMMSGRVTGREDIDRFDTIRVKDLQIVDENGNLHARMSAKEDSVSLIMSAGNASRKNSILIAASQDVGSYISMADDKEERIFSPLGVDKAEKLKEEESADETSDSAVTPKGTSSPLKFTGTTSRKTEPFTIRKKAVVRWSLKKVGKGIATLDATLYDAKTGDIEDSLISTYEAGSEKTYIYKPGMYYMNISANGQYEIEIEEL